MDGDGELQLGDDVNAGLPCASDTAERHGGSSNMKDASDTSVSDSNNNAGATASGGGGGGGGGDDDGGHDDDDGGDGDDGASGEKGDDEDDDNDDDDDDDEGEEEEDYEEDDDDDSDEDRMHIDIPDEVEEDDRDSTDGEPPPSQISPGAAAESTVTTEKRVPVQSQRMRDYQAMQQIVSQTSRPRECPICGRVLHSGPGFRYHLSTHHAGKESFTCDTCKKKFRSFNGLKYHRKRKRCKGLSMSEAGVSEGLTSLPPSSLTSSQASGALLPPPIKTTFEEEFHAQRLMELAKIATSPQSPLLQSPGPDSRGSVSRVFFDDPEASAVMTLSSMMRSSESRKSVEACSSTTSQYSSLQHQHPHQQQQQQQQLQQQQQKQQTQHPPQDSKSKRPMNGFMLFAQQHRAELKKKYPNTNNRMISTKLSEEWTNLPDGVRQQWKDEAKVKAEQQLKEHPDCWKRKK
ncbi:hypothetical protein EGW08_019797 [Elysia chlorotica]|uniref:HMG box domain-containing protein n=1 Tax=Elysia chlorotica TaxID=188477 RepID=A0A3S0ZDF6_ELYCH|nr:hypothetical protein EGW08_019797 [Elysia chlorotica]